MEKRLRTTDLTNKLRILRSVEDFANHAQFVFSWLTWTVYEFAIQQKDQNHTGIIRCC